MSNTTEPARRADERTLDADLVDEAEVFMVERGWNMQNAIPALMAAFVRQQTADLRNELDRVKRELADVQKIREEGNAG
jgi:hypothetical protein